MLNQRILCIPQALTKSSMTKSNGKVLSFFFVRAHGLNMYIFKQRNANH